MPARVIFERSRHRRYMARPFHLMVDGATVAVLWRGGVVEVEVRPGIHDVVAEMDDYQSAPVRLRVGEDEIVRLHCAPNRQARFTAPWWSLLSRRLQTRYQRLHDPTGKGVVVLELVEESHGSQP